LKKTHLTFLEISNYIFWQIFQLGTEVFTIFIKTYNVGCKQQLKFQYKFILENKFSYKFREKYIFWIILKYLSLMSYWRARKVQNLLLKLFIIAVNIFFSKLFSIKKLNKITKKVFLFVLFRGKRSELQISQRQNSKRTSKKVQSIRTSKLSF
jgi:hypothetical protein